MNWIILAVAAFGGIGAMVGSSACGGSSGNGGAGGGSGCTTDADCASGEFCDDMSGECVATMGTCKTDSDCPDPGDTCDPTTGYCSFSGCVADTDCLMGETCDTTSGKCMGTPMTEPMCHQCACTDILSMGGCGNVCDSAQNGNPNTPNFCNGSNALPQCAKCLSDNCGGITDPPDPTNPSACM